MNVVMYSCTIYFLQIGVFFQILTVRLRADRQTYFGNNIAKLAAYLGSKHKNYFLKNLACRLTKLLCHLLTGSNSNNGSNAPKFVIKCTFCDKPHESQDCRIVTSIDARRNIA